MNFGQIIVWLAFFSALGAMYFFYKEGKQSLAAGHKIRQTGNTLPLRFFWAMTLAVVVASIHLFYLLFTHQFQYSYVAEYSSSSQPMLYLISAFWAGQEGTFLLWALLTSVMGIVLHKTASEHDSYAMSVVSAFSVFLYLIMILKSPFGTSSTTPHDGTGMNPLLQDPWMVIHPPILFIGYAATLFPFALTVSALARRKYEHWHEAGFSWTLFAALTLGAGIIIGGFWAYEVLGWGGYWGWDPVENSSLVPWLTLLALIHGLLVHKTKGSLARTNIFLAIISFLFVLYATFLTRSGVLSDFSVHSFVDLGIGKYLIGVMIVSTLLGFGYFSSRFKEIHSPKIDISSLNRELTLVLSIFVLLLGAVFTFVGMSSPIFTGLVGKASQVDTSFYNKVNLPVAIGIALLLGVTPFLGWTEENKSAFLKRLSMPLVLTALSCVIAYVAGVQTVSLMVFVGSASFALISNTIIAFRQYKAGWTSLGGQIAHIGVALLLIGIIGSGKFDQTKQVMLKQNEPQSIDGYQFLFTGMSDMQAVKPVINLEVSDGKMSYLATPKLYFSNYNQAMMREPDIKIFPLKDLYISPLDLKIPEEHSEGLVYELSKGETKEIAGYKITFTRFDMSTHGQEGMMAVGSVLNVSVNGKAQEVIPRLMISDRGERQAVPADLPAIHSGTDGHEGAHVFLNAISVEEKKVYLEIHGAGEKSAAANVPQLILEISTKPLMMVVWTGVVLIVGGTVISFKRRVTEKVSA